MDAQERIAALRAAEHRFWPKVNKDAPNGCWEWTAFLLRGGYGQFVFRDGSTKLIRSHRFAYELLVGPIPDGLVLDHLGRNRACVNPDHLEPVTNAENIARGSRATQTHCKRGHELSPENLLATTKYRRCRICNALHQIRAHRERGGGPRLRVVDQKVCKHGHERTPENTYVRPDGSPACRECRRVSAARSRARLAAVNAAAMQSPEPLTPAAKPL
jgi:hypothetical protein